MKKARLLMVLGIGLLPWCLLAQDHNWWANNVGWDGKTHWSRYISSAPRYLGPNALPIPQMYAGLIPAGTNFGLSLNTHVTVGDVTHNTALYVQHNIMPKVLSFELYWVPAEFFTESHAIKTERKIFYQFYNNRFASGDLFLNTYFQVLREEKNNIDVAVRLGYRFPSSTLQGAARFTDAMGYYLDGSFGKALIKGRSQLSVMGMFGIHVWQTNVDNQYQDDSILYGVGLRWTNPHWTLETAYRGYYGYIDNGDRPEALSLKGRYRFANWTVFGGCQQGFRDLLYRSAELGLMFGLGKKK